MKFLFRRFKELTLFFKIFTAIYLLLAIGLVYKIAKYLLGVPDSPLLFVGFHTSALGTAGLRSFYLICILLFLWGIFKKQMLGYYAIQTYHIFVLLNAIISGIGLFVRRQYFSDYFSAKAAQLTKLPPPSANIAFYTSVATSFVLISLLFLLTLAVKKRKSEFH